jgi:alpha-D-xyloside xylohydrolase
MVKLRYALHPYLYAAANESVRNAVPIMRPMVYGYPQDPDAQAADLQYLLGKDLLVAPFFRPGGGRLVWFPPGEWVHYSDGSSVRGPGFRNVTLSLELAPLWLRAGSAIPLTTPGLRMGEGNYRLLTLVLVGTETSEPPSTRIDLPSMGDLAITIEPDGHDQLAITVPAGSPPLALRFMGNEPSFVISINGTPTPPRRQRSLFPEHSPTTAE